MPSLPQDGGLNPGHWPQQSMGLSGQDAGQGARAAYLTLVAAGAMGTLRAFSQGAVGGIAAAAAAFLWRWWEWA